MAVTINGTTGIAGVDGSASTPAVQGTDTNTGIFFPAADTIAFGEGGAEAMRIDSSGNLGLSVTPSAWSVGTALQVKRASFYTYNNDSVEIVQNGAVISGAWQRIGADFATKYEQGSGNHIWYSAASSTAGSAITWSERGRINSNGNLLVGTTSAGAGVGYETRIAVSRDSDCALFKYVSAPGGATGAYPLYVWNTADSGNNNFQAFLTEGTATERGKIDYNRGAGQVRYNTTSDATLKNIIGDADGQKSVDILNSTRIREFAWKDDTTQKPQIGVIAQELYETFKGAVSVGGDVEKTDEEGNVTTKYNPWGVDKTAFTFHLVAGWQAHEKKIAEQQSKIDALEARLAALEAK